MGSQIKRILADREGFEPPGLWGPSVFKTDTLNQTQTSIQRRRNHREKIKPYGDDRTWTGNLMLAKHILYRWVTSPINIHTYWWTFLDFGIKSISGLWSIPGVKGFEPLNLDTKNRRLTAWLYSNPYNWVITDSNRWHSRCKRGTLPTELITLLRRRRDSPLKSIPSSVTFTES